MSENKSRKEYLKADLPKKQYALRLLKFMQTHTDENHTLSLNNIQKLFNEEYADTRVEIDIKTLRSNLDTLIDCGYPISYTEVKQKNKKDTHRTDWYYQHEFVQGELRLLIDCVMFTGALPEQQRDKLIQKLENLSSEHFHSVMPAVNADVYNRLDKSTFLLTIETLHTAIAEEKQVQFCYQDCGIDFQWHTRKHPDGSEKVYIVSPYQLIAANGRTYLLCCQSGKEGISHFRLDRITEARMLDTSAISLRKIHGFEASGMQLSKYLAEHPHLWSGDPVRITFRCPEFLMNDVVDWFGIYADAVPDPEHKDMLIVQVMASESAMFRWAVQYADEVEVLYPDTLRQRVKDSLYRAWRKYDKESD